MTFGPTTPQRVASQPLPAALRAALGGLGVGACAYAATGTARVLLSPGLEVVSPAGWVVAPVLVFAEGLFWGLAGGAVLLVPPAVVVLRAVAPAIAAPGSAPSLRWRVALGLWGALFAPLFAFGLRGRAVDGALLGLSLWIGVRRAVAQLEARLARR